jgi:hypothetical protein
MFISELIDHKDSFSLRIESQDEQALQTSLVLAIRTRNPQQISSFGLYVDLCANCPNKYNI